MRFFFTVLLSILSILSNSQTTDFRHLKEKGKKLELKFNKKPEIKLERSGNPGKLFFFGMLFFYQKVLSPQLSSNCEFTLSCSSFSVESIRQKGVLKGILLTADRLTRCNGSAHNESENFLIDHHTGKVTDKPDFYFD